MARSLLSLKKQKTPPKKPTENMAQTADIQQRRIMRHVDGEHD